MEQLKDAAKIVELIREPAFSVKDGIVAAVNAAAAGYFIEPGTEISRLLETGAEEYAAFSGGCLYLNITVLGQSLAASVTRRLGYDLLRLEKQADDPELQALALAARELRKPLGNILTSAEQLFPEDPDTRKQVSQLNRGLYQMLRLISNMADAERYCRGDAGHQETRDICGVIGEVMNRAAMLTEKAGVCLTYEGHPESIYCLTDSEKLERAIFNIVSNALKFTPQGGTITAKLTRRGCRLYLSVQDSGCGIADSVREELFSRYTREAGIEDGRFGIGLGMVMVRAAAAIHGGTVLVDHPGETGTRITMSLSIRQSTGAQVRSPIRMPDYTGERDHGLIELSEVLPEYLYDPNDLL